LFSTSWRLKTTFVYYFKETKNIILKETKKTAFTFYFNQFKETKNTMETKQQILFSTSRRLKMGFVFYFKETKNSSSFLLCGV